MNIDAQWYVIAGLIVAAVVGFVLVRGRRVRSARESDLPSGSLPPGWQFYSNPTTLEQPGTVFRIDPNGRKYAVDLLKVAIQSGEEAAGKVEESVNATTGMVARFIGLPNVSASVGAQKTENFVYEITNPVREVIPDVEIDKVLPAFLAALDYRRGHRYFVIREARKASAICYKLTQKQIENMGGEVSIQLLSAKGNIFSSDNSGQYTLEQDFKTPMRIVFLPEEIQPVAQALANEKPRLGLVPVKRPLQWEDPP